MPTGVPRVALWALVVVMLAATLVPTPGAWAAGPSSYALNGHVTTAGAVPVPQGVTVDLISGATHQVYTTTTTAGGAYSFTYSSTSNNLAPGSWGVWVPPQGNLSLLGCKPCGILPATPQPTFFYETAQNLTSIASARSITGVSVLRYNSTIFGNATDGSSPAAGANVQLLAPGYNAFILSNNTTLSHGNFSLKVPYGTWVLRTTLPGTPDQYDYQQVTVNANRMTVDPSISAYLTHGTIYQSASPTVQVPYGGNATVYDTGTGDIYSSPIVGGGFYSVGTYPAGFSGGSPETFQIVLQSIGFQTVHYALTVSSANTTGVVPHDVWTPAQYAPATYLTDLTYSTNFKWLNTTTVANLGNDSVLPELPNASVGQLWAQLALDWQHNLSFASANLPTVEAWIQSEGAFFPAGQAQAMVNSTGYNETSGGAFNITSTCATSFCGLSSNASIRYTWGKDYSLNGTAPTNATSYPVAFNFRHPTNFQAINYTIALPSGYALQAGTTAPTGTRLVADGPGGTWTKFTLVSLPWAAASGTASFTFVKYGSVTANVSASVSNFAFSKDNVLNSTHGNYSVIVGEGQNVSFSAAGSTFPAGVNGSRYVWTWGDSSSPSTATIPTSYHTYSASGEFNGSLNVTSSGGTQASVAFHVYVGSGGVQGTIISNASAWEKRTSGGVAYLFVNSSTSLTFNATGFNSTLYTGGPTGQLSVAAWNATDGPKNQTSNFTASSGAYVADNFSVTFSAAGDSEYLSSASIGGTSVSFLGWQYNVTVRVWDAVGKYATQRIDVLVQDTQKPTSVATVQDSGGHNVTNSALTEGTNHTVEVKLVSSYAYDANGGSLVKYTWNLTNSGNNSVNRSITQLNRTGFRAPLPALVWLQPQTKQYTINLTVWDRAGNTAYNVASFTVAVNTSARPVLAVGNLTAPSSMTDQSSYTVWVNVTNTLGQNSTAMGVQVRFYLLPPSGSGTPISVGGSPNTVQFYNYNNATGVVASSANATGSINLKYNETVRAQISFNPARTGTWELWANATAINEFTGDYATGGNQAHVSVSLVANPIVLDEEIGAGVVIVLALIFLLVYWFYLRPRQGRSTSSSRSDRGAKKEKADNKPSSSDKDDDDE